MKIKTVLLLGLVLTFVLTGCKAEAVPSPIATQPPTEVVIQETKAIETEVPATVAPEKTEDKLTKPYSEFKIVALLSGVITDNGWSANMYNAIMNLKEKYGLTAEYVESVSASDMEEYLRGYATKNYDLVIAHGSQFIDAVNAVAGDFPDTLFIVSFATGKISEFENVAGVAPVGQGLLSGIVAGALTTTNKVAWLGSVENPSISEDMKFFEPGVRLVNPDAEVITGYIGSATDAEKGKEMAMNLISGGVDVISHQANAAGLGVLQAAEEAGILAVGVNTDQYSVAPDAVVTSVLRNFTGIYEDLFPKIAEGNFKGGVYPYGVKDGGCYLSDWHGWKEKLPAEKVKLIDDTIEGIKTDKIVVPTPGN